jgi:hypothetical protein
LRACGKLGLGAAMLATRWGGAFDFRGREAMRRLRS